MTTTTTTITKAPSLFAIDCHWSEDWAESDYSTGYVFATEEEAAAAGQAALAPRTEPVEWQGFYVISEERDEVYDEPVVEKLYHKNLRNDVVKSV